MPDFVVITGLNGVGKSHLLSGVAGEVIRVMENKKVLGPVKFFKAQSLTPSHIDRLVVERLDHENIIFHLFEEYLLQNSRDSTIELGDIIQDPEKKKIIEQVAQNTGKDLTELKQEDFQKQLFQSQSSKWKDPFYLNFLKLFKGYQEKIFNNDVRQFRNHKYGNVSYLKKEEFRSIHGAPPWEVVNRILVISKLGYYFKALKDPAPGEELQLKLVRRQDKAEIDLNDLSSGEKVLISLVLALYNNDFEPDIPGVLLLEEPDAPLHPAMIKQFLDVIQKLFIQEKGIKVLMTSHSPATVALAPDSSLFVMNRVGKRVEKTSKDKAIRVLTAGIPSFSMNYDNRRQVFVESKHDVTFYERVYQKLSVHLDNEISLHFISSGVGGQGDCNQVREIVNKLSSFGNTSIYGIIDWDGKNNGNNFVKVLGKNHRYSIENYIFDPILLAAFLLREKFIRRESIGLRPNENYTDFKNFEDGHIQQIADYIEGRIRPEYEHSRREMDFNRVAQQKVVYVGGNTIRISNLLLVNQGHVLEERIKDAFPQLKRYQVEGQLKKEIILKVIDDIPEFISIDLLKILTDIQKGQIYPGQ